MVKQRTRILAGLLVGIVVLAVIYLALGKYDDPFILVSGAFLLLDLGLACGVLWQITAEGKDGYLTNLAFPYVVRGALALSAGLSLAVTVLYLTGTWDFPLPWFVVLQILVFGFGAWKLLAVGAGRSEIDAVGARVKAQTGNWKLLMADAESLARETPEKARPDVQRVRDAIRFADPMSLPETAAIEQEISQKLVQLKKLALDGEDTTMVAQQLVNAVQDRATRQKLLK